MRNRNAKVLQVYSERITNSKVIKYLIVIFYKHTILPTKLQFNF